MIEKVSPKLKTRKVIKKPKTKKNKKNPPKKHKKFFSGLSFLSNHLLSIWCSSNT